MTEVGRHPRGTPLPQPFQGHWVDPQSPDWRLEIDGGVVICGGIDSGHDFFDLKEIDGALLVDFGIDDQAVEAIDSYTRDKLTNLVVDPGGKLHGYNLKWASTFERAQ